MSLSWWSVDSRMGRTCSLSMTRSIKGGFFDLVSIPWLCFGVRRKRTVTIAHQRVTTTLDSGIAWLPFLSQALIFLLNSYPLLSLVASLALCNGYLKSSFWWYQMGYYRLPNLVPQVPHLRRQQIPPDGDIYRPSCETIRSGISQSWYYLFTPSPAVHACAALLPAAEFSSILQNPNIEGYSALYWAIMSHRKDAIMAFTEFASKLLSAWHGSRS